MDEMTMLQSGEAAAPSSVVKDTRHGVATLN